MRSHEQITGREDSPSGNSEGGDSSNVRTLSRERGVGHGRAGRDGSGQVPDGNVAVDGALVVGGVDDDLADADLGATGGAQLLRKGVSILIRSSPQENVPKRRLTLEPARTRTEEAAWSTEQ